MKVPADMDVKTYGRDSRVLQEVNGLCGCAEAEETESCAVYEKRASGGDLSIRPLNLCFEELFRKRG